MTPWQRRARLGVAIVGILTALGVYLGFKERRPAARAITAQLPPRVISESIGGEVEQLQATRRQYQVTYARMQVYDDETSRLFKVEIQAVNRDGRMFVITADEATRTKINRDISLSGHIKLVDEDGFELFTEKGAFNEETGVARADGQVNFRKGRMQGSGVGMTYDEPADVLQIEHEARVEVAPTEGQEGITFTAGASTLDRINDLLVLTGAVHAVHGQQVTDASDATAHLSENEELLKTVELRGGSRVSGGLGSVSSLSANDIDLDYTDDGQAIERALLKTNSVVTMTGEAGESGRRVSGDMLDVRMRADRSLDHVTGTGGVEMTLPSTKDGPARTVTAQTLDASADATGALTAARFAQNVRFTEQNGKEGQRTTTSRVLILDMKDSVASRALFQEDVKFTEQNGKQGLRTATSKTLVLDMKDSVVSRAVFQEDATFIDGDMRGNAAEARYEPSAGRLFLRGRDARGDPGVENPQIDVEAEEIDVELETRRIDARARVKSNVRSEKDAPAAATQADSSQLPGLLDRDQPASITADNLVYDGEAGVAVYTGRARLTQKATRIRSHTLELRQKLGDLTARGDVTSSLVLEGGNAAPSESESDTLQYVDASRTITFTAARQGTGQPPVPLARLKGREGDVSGRRLTVHLAPAESRLERLEAVDDVLARIEGRTVRGAVLNYRASDETYVVTGTRSSPLVVEERCRTRGGRTLTYVRSTDTMDIKGEDQFTDSQRKESCR